MPTESDFQQQAQILAQRRQQLEEQQKKVEEFKVIPSYSSQELRSQTRDRTTRPINALMERTKKQSKVIERKQEKESALSQIGQALQEQTQLESQYEQQYQEWQSQQQQAELTQLAYDVYSGKVTSNSEIRNKLATLPKGVREKIQSKVNEAEASFQRQQERLGALQYKEKVEGLVPETLKVDILHAKISPTAFEGFSESSLKKLKESGLIELKPSGETINELPIETQSVPVQMSLIPENKNVIQKVSDFGKSVFQRIVSGAGKTIDIAGKGINVIGNLPVTLPTEKGKVNMKAATISGAAKEFERGLKGFGGYVGKGYENLFATLGVPTETTTKPRENILLNKFNIPSIKIKGGKDYSQSQSYKTGAGLFVKLAEKTPEYGLFGTLVGVATVIGGNVLTTSSALSPGELEKAKSRELEILYKTQPEVEEGYKKLTREEIKQEYSTDVEKQLKSNAQVNLGIALGTAGLLGGIKAGKILFGERVLSVEGAYTGEKSPQIIESLTKVRNPSIKVTEPNIPLATVESPSAEYFREASIKKITTGIKNIITKIGEKTGIKSLEFAPKITIIKKPQAIIDTLRNPFIDNSIAVLERTKVGKTGLGKPETIILKAGKGVDFTAEEISKFPLLEFMKQRLLKNMFKDVTGISSNIVPYPAQGKLGANVLTSISLKTGKIQQTALLTSKTPIAKIGEGIFKGTKVYRVDQIMKDITSGFPRRTGITPIIKGVQYEFPKVQAPEGFLKKLNPFYKPEPERLAGITILKPSGGTKTPFSITFPDIKSIKLPPIKTTMSLPSVKSNVLPSVSAAEIKTAAASAYTGTGLYERTEGGLLPGTQVTGVIKPSFDGSQITSQDLSPVSVTSPKIIGTPISKVDVTTIGITKVGTGIITVPSLTTKEEIKLKLPIVNILKESLITKTPQQTKKPSRLMTLPRIPTRPIKTPTTIFGLPSEKVSTKKEKTIYEKVFEAFGRRFGKDISLGKTKSKKKAEEELEKFLSRTLGASGFVEFEGKKVTTGLIKRKGYRPSKVEPLRVVQMRSQRLGTFGERREIKGAKKKKKIKWF